MIDFVCKLISYKLVKLYNFNLQTKCVIKTCVDTKIIEINAPETSHQFIYRQISFSIYNKAGSDIIVVLRMFCMGADTSLFVRMCVCALWDEIYVIYVLTSST